MKPSDALNQRQEEIRRIVALNDASNPRVYGSTARGEDTEDSDLDILVDPVHEKTTLLSLSRIEAELTALLGLKVDVQTPMSLSKRFRDEVVNEAIAI